MSRKKTDPAQNGERYFVRYCLIYTPPWNGGLGAIASARGQRLSANMMLLRSSSDVPINQLCQTAE